MLSFILATVLLTQTQPPKATEEQISAAFVKSFLGRSHLQKTFKCQLTVLTKDGDNSTLIVYNYQTTIGDSPSLFRTEGDVQVGVDSKLKHFIIVGDGKNLTSYDQSNNVYRVIPQNSKNYDNSFLSSGLIPSVLIKSSQGIKPPISIPKILDPQAAKEALEIIPNLFAQNGIISTSYQQASDERYSMILRFSQEKDRSPGTINLTLDNRNLYLQRLRVEIPLEDKASLTVTDVVESVTPASPLVKFKFDIPKRAKKVKELPPLHENESSPR